MKKLLVIFLSLVMLFNLSACNNGKKSEETNKEQDVSKVAVPNESVQSDINTTKYPTLPADGPEYNFAMATSAPEKSTAYLIMSKFKDTLESSSNGKITVDLYPNGQLGNDSELASSCLQENITMVYQSGSTHSTTIPQSAIFDTPFLLAGYDSAKIEDVIINSDFRKMYNTYYENGGYKLLTVKVVDSMNLSSNIPVNSLKDLKGLKVRTAQSESRMSLWQSLGANPTPLPYGELYMALQQGLVDASDNVYSNVVSGKLVEQQKYIIPTNHMMPSMELIMNKKIYDELPAEYQKLIDMVSVDTNHFDFETSRTDQDESYRQIVEDYGLEVCEVSDEFRNEMISAAKSSIDSTKKLVNDDKLYQTLEENLKK